MVFKGGDEDITFKKFRLLNKGKAHILDPLSYHKCEDNLLMLKAGRLKACNFEPVARFYASAFTTSKFLKYTIRNIY